MPCIPSTRTNTRLSFLATTTGLMILIVVTNVVYELDTGLELLALPQPLLKSSTSLAEVATKFSEYYGTAFSTLNYADSEVDDDMLSNDSSSFPNAHSNNTTRPESDRNFDNVLLLGQFNYDTNVSLVQHWARRWSQVFSNIHVRGPFSPDNLDALRQCGIQAFYGEEDRGYYSPMKNFGDSLKAAAQVEGIIGVMYVHDDLLVNMTNLVEFGFPWESTVMSQLMEQDSWRPIIRMDGRNEVVHYYVPRIRRRRTEFVRNVSVAAGQGPFASWRWWKEVLPGALELSKDKRAEPYLDGEMFPFYGNAVGDFGYVPTKFASEFSFLADMMVEHRVFLEIGMPTLMGLMSRKVNASYKFAEYCTEVSNRSFPLVWVPACILAERGDTPCGSAYYPKPELPTAPFSLYHPIKMSVDIDIWDAAFNAVVLQRPHEFLVRAGAVNATEVSPG